MGSGVGTGSLTVEVGVTMLELELELVLVELVVMGAGVLVEVGVVDEEEGGGKTTGKNSCQLNDAHDSPAHGFRDMLA
jgi:hypothetical protein